jgi:hypothetical protein
VERQPLEPPATRGKPSLAVHVRADHHDLAGPAVHVGTDHDVRARLGEPRLGLGLWLPAATAHELAGDPATLDRLRTGLDRHGLEVVTLNAFPYAGFHAPVVKRDVYSPDWSTRRRLDYTLDCARVLAALLPDDASRGSISTLPLGWRSPWFTDRDRAAR